jgi:hypothetical protein
LKVAMTGGRAVVIGDKDTPILRDALAWLTQTDRLTGNLVSLSGALP